MCNRHGYYLAFNENGDVVGIKDPSARTSLLEFIPSPDGTVRIRGIIDEISDRLYIAMDKKGRLYAEKDRLNENTLFHENTAPVR